MVVTLGCSLGLLFVYLVLSARTYYPDTVQTTTIVRRAAPAEPPLKISEAGLEQELERVIGTQLSAFREDDYPKAYEFASSTIKANMALPAFERMVKTMYPVIAQSSDAQFGVILDNGDHALVNVTIVGSAGRSHHYQYILDHERAGWKISGVVEVKSTGTTI
jgi:hypothetical protein